MDDEQIKSLRHSFTNPHREDLPKPKVNKFGHTVLGDERDLPETDIELKIDDLGDLSAEPKQSVFDSPEFQKWAQKQPNSEQSEPDQNMIEPVIGNYTPQNEILARLLNELDEMEGTKEKFKAHPNPDGTVQIDPNTKINFGPEKSFKECLNKDCLYELTKDAKFCLKCGTPQMPKYCIECGYCFPGMEKFCPECGNKR